LSPHGTGGWLFQSGDGPGVFGQTDSGTDPSRDREQYAIHHQESSPWRSAGSCCRSNESENSTRIPAAILGSAEHCKDGLEVASEMSSSWGVWCKTSCGDAQSRAPPLEVAHARCASPRVPYAPMRIARSLRA